MKRMKSLHLFVVFASVALSYVILSACSSDEEYDMNNGLTLASGMMTRAEGDAGTYPGNSADSVLTAVIVERTIQAYFNNNTLERGLTYSLRFSINPQNTTVRSVELFNFRLPFYDENSASAEISHVDIEKRKCNVKLILLSNSIYNKQTIDDKNVTFELE